MTAWLLIGMLASAGTGTSTGAAPATSPTPVAAPPSTTATTVKTAPAAGANQSLDHLQVELQTTGGKNFLVATPKVSTKAPPQRIGIQMGKGDVFSTQANLTCETAKKERAFAVLTAEEAKKPGALKQPRAWVADEKTQKLRSAGPDENITCK